MSRGITGGLPHHLGGRLGQQPSGVGRRTPALQCLARVILIGPARAGERLPPGGNHCENQDDNDSIPIRIRAIPLRLFRIISRVRVDVRSCVELDGSARRGAGCLEVRHGPGLDRALLYSRRIVLALPIVVRGRNRRADVSIHPQSVGGKSEYKLAGACSIRVPTKVVFRLAGVLPEVTGLLQSFFIRVKSDHDKCLIVISAGRECITRHSVDVHL
jgi:hypothetical protein